MRKGNSLTKKIAKEKAKTDLGKKKLEEMNKSVWLNNISIAKKPKLIISFSMNEYIKKLHGIYPSKEWMGLAKVIQDEEKNFHLVDIIHPEQKASGAEVESTDKGMKDLKDWILENDPEGMESWTCYLHSHHGMGVFWSGTDDQCRLDLNDGRPFSISIVTAYSKLNKEDISYKGCINFYKPHNVEIDFDIEIDQDSEIAQIIAKEKSDIEKIMKEIEGKYVSDHNHQPDFSMITELLGNEVLDELNKNFKSIQTKIHKSKIIQEQVEALSGREKNEDVVALHEWMDDRAKMLKDALPKPITYNYVNYYGWDSKVVSSWTQHKYDPRDSTTIKYTSTAPADCTYAYNPFSVEDKLTSPAPSQGMDFFEFDEFYNLNKFPNEKEYKHYYTEGRFPNKEALFKDIHILAFKDTFSIYPYLLNGIRYTIGSRGRISLDQYIIENYDTNF